MMRRTILPDDFDLQARRHVRLRVSPLAWLHVQYAWHGPWVVTWERYANWSIWHLGPLHVSLDPR